MAQVRKHSFPPEDIATTTVPRRKAPPMAETPPLPVDRIPPLTRRELECLGWCADGKSYWETAAILGISERTVSFHMEAVRGKLTAATNAHAVAMALRAGLLEPASQQGLR